MNFLLSAWEQLTPAARWRWVSRAGLFVLLAVVICILQGMESPWEGWAGRHLRQGTRLKFEETVQVGLWCGFCGDAVLIGLMLATSPWWMRWSGLGEAEAASRAMPADDRKSAARSASGRTRRLVWLGVGLGVAFILRSAHMDAPITHDEQDTVRRDILGFVQADEQGRPQHRVLPWSSTFWEDGGANNPFLFSIVARVSLRLWQAVTGAEPWQLNRVVLRLFALVPGLVSLAALWWWLGAVGLPRAGNFALVFGAIHPMHIQYSTEARGYALVMMFTVLAVAFAWRALRGGRWRDWFGVGGSLFGMLYSYPGSLYFAVSLGLALTAWLVRQWRRSGEAHGRDGHATVGCDENSGRRGLMRFLVACCAAAVVYLPLVFPAVPQVMTYLPRIRGALESPWLVVTWTEFATGVMMPPFNEILQWKAAHPIRSAVEVPSIWMADWRCLSTRFVPREPVLSATAFLVMPALMFAGIRHIVRRSRLCRPLIAAGFVAPVIAYAYHLWPQTPILFYWYLIYALPFVIALVAGGIDGIGEKCAAMWRWKYAGWLPATAFLAIFVMVNADGPGRRRWFPKSQANPVAFARGPFLYVTHPDGMTERIPSDDPRRRQDASRGPEPTPTQPGQPPDSPDASLFREP